MEAVPYRPLVTSRISSDSCQDDEKRLACANVFEVLRPYLENADTTYNGEDWHTYHSEVVTRIKQDPTLSHQITKAALDIYFRTIYDNPYVRVLTSDELGLRFDDARLNFDLPRCKVTFNAFAPEVVSKVLSTLRTEAWKLTCTKIIFDLRENTGGDFQSALELSAAFLEDEEPVLQYRSVDDLDSSDGTFVTINPADLHDRLNLPVVIQISPRSASAAEIFTYILKEKANATIVGDPSFGKFTLLEQVLLYRTPTIELILLLPKGQLYSIDGTPLEGQPIIPHYSSHP